MMTNFEIEKRIRELYELSEALSEQYVYEMRILPSSERDEYYQGLFAKIREEAKELYKLYQPPRYINNVEDNKEYLREQARLRADFYSKCKCK